MTNKLYAGIDLHSNNSVVAIYDPQTERTICSKRLNNDIDAIRSFLLAHQERLESVSVESTYNYYWLVDDLQSAGFRVELAHTAKLGTYGDLKNSNDHSDATWLAKMASLNVLPTGYIYPAQERGLREMVRQRMKLVQMRTRLLLMMQSMVTRYSGVTIKSDDLRVITKNELKKFLQDEQAEMCFMQERVTLLQLDKTIMNLEKSCLAQIKEDENFKLLKSIPGVGAILALVILLETGSIYRFKEAKNYCSYCRRVESKRMSNGKKKGNGNRKNGNKYLSWAFMEAAQHAIKNYDSIRNYYHRRKNKKHSVSVRSAIGHKLAASAYYILRDKVEFDMTKSF